MRTGGRFPPSLALSHSSEITILASILRLGDSSVPAMSTILQMRALYVFKKGKCKSRPELCTRRILNVTDCSPKIENNDHAVV